MTQGDCAYDADDTESSLTLKKSQKKDGYDKFRRELEGIQDKDDVEESQDQHLPQRQDGGGFC